MPKRMTIIVENNGGTKLPFEFKKDNNIDKMIPALKENFPDWNIITIVIVNTDDEESA